jgi:hypothetical protein
VKSLDFIGIDHHEVFASALTSNSTYSFSFEADNLVVNKDSVIKSHQKILRKIMK